MATHCTVWLSDHLPIIVHMLDDVKMRNLSEPIEEFTDWERFQSLASDLISPRVEINTGVETDKAARYFTSSIASAYRLSTSNVILSAYGELALQVGAVTDETVKCGREFCGTST
jgi:hypothetical protein